MAACGTYGASMSEMIYRILELQEKIKIRDNRFQEIMTENVSKLGREMVRQIWCGTKVTRRMN